MKGVEKMSREERIEEITLIVKDAVSEYAKINCVNLEYHFLVLDKYEINRLAKRIAENINAKVYRKASEIDKLENVPLKEIEMIIRATENNITVIEKTFYFDLVVRLKKSKRKDLLDRLLAITPYENKSERNDNGT